MLLTAVIVTVPVAPVPKTTCPTAKATGPAKVPVTKALVLAPDATYALAKPDVNVAVSTRMLMVSAAVGVAKFTRVQVPMFVPSVTRYLCAPFC